MNIFTQIFLIILITICLTFIVLKLFIRIFEKYQILDNPKKYKKNRAPIPYGIGIIFFLIFLIISLVGVFPGLNYQLSHKLELIWFFSAIISIISFLDDRYNISALGRLITQIIIGTIIGLTSIKIGYISGIFGGTIDLSFYSFELLGYTIYLIPVIFTMLWYVFIFNALNWTDGITGNTTLISFISFLIIFMLGVKLYFTDSYIGGIQNAEFIMKTTAILLSILGVYFVFDIKEKVLMGDAGTMFLGFMLATLGIISGGKIATVLVVFGIYSVDAVLVATRRILKGKSPLNGDFTHLHHRLKDAGLTTNQTLILIGSSSFIFGALSLFLNKPGKIVLFLGIIIFVLFLEKFIIRFRKKSNTN